MKTSYSSLHTFTIARKRSELWHIVNLYPCIVRVECNTRYTNVLTYIPCQRNTCTLVIALISTFTHDQVIFMTVWWCNLWNVHVLTNLTYRNCQNNSIQRQYFLNTICPIVCTTLSTCTSFRKFYEVCVAF